MNNQQLIGKKQKRQEERERKRREKELVIATKNIHKETTKLNKRLKVSIKRRINEEQLVSTTEQGPITSKKRKEKVIYDTITDFQYGYVPSKKTRRMSSSM